MSDYEIVFNILFEPFRGWQPAALIVAGLAVIGVAWSLREKRRIALSLAGAIFAAFGTLMLWLGWSEYLDLREAFRTGHVLTVEATARHNPGEESTLIIAGERFDLGSRYTSAYDQSRLNLNGRCVRVLYVRRLEQNYIVWLGIRRSRCTPPIAPAPPASPALPVGPPPQT